MTSTTVGPREKAIFTQTLAPFLHGLMGCQCTIELKNEIHVRGLITSVDCFMNITMEDACMTSPSGQTSKFEFFFLQRKYIRDVRIPDTLSVQKVLKDQVDIATGVKMREERRKMKERRAKILRKKEAKRMANPNV